jgi:hypothetical protein
VSSAADINALRGSLPAPGDRLARRGVVADLYVFGGTAMALAYDSRRAEATLELWLPRTAAAQPTPG